MSYNYPDMEEGEWEHLPFPEAVEYLRIRHLPFGAYAMEVLGYIAEHGTSRGIGEGTGIRNLNVLFSCYKKLEALGYIKRERDELGYGMYRVTERGEKYLSGF